jgi:hypothetical protein
MANIRIGWKGLTGANTLAYYDLLKIMAIKSCVMLDPVIERLFM